MRLMSKCIATGLSMMLISTTVFAKPPEHAKNKKYKKEKNIPYGLQKKLQRTGELPPGWQKKIKSGEVVSDDILAHGKVLNPKDLGNVPDTKYSKIYEIQDKIIRIHKATNVILDVLK